MHNSGNMKFRMGGYVIADKFLPFGGGQLAEHIRWYTLSGCSR